MEGLSPAIDQEWMRKINRALNVDLPHVLRDMGNELKRDGHNSWRISGYGGLIVWKKDDDLWRWKRFSTDEHGDSISFLTEFHGMDRKKAVDTLISYSTGTESRLIDCSMSTKGAGASKLTQRFIRKVHTPPDIWQRGALTLVTWAEDNLWSGDGTECLDWLHARGLQDNTIRSARLGLIPQDYWPRREVWGLKKEEQKDKLWIPRGLLIPIIDRDGNILRLEVRRFGQDDHRYHVLNGSWMGSLVLGELRTPLIICETDLDAWLINQEAGDLITAASLNGAGSKPDRYFATYLITAPTILVSLDSDTAGKKASEWWEKTFPNSKRWPVPWSKDPADAFGQAPGLIRRWIQCGLQ